MSEFENNNVENGAENTPDVPTSDWQTPQNNTPPEKPRWEDSWYRSGPLQSTSHETQTPPTQPTPPPPPQWTPPAPPPKKRKANAVVVVLAVLGAAAILLLTVLLAMTLGDSMGNPSSDGDGEDSSSVSDVGGADAPSLHISDWADDDGGLAASEIVNKNLDSTVVITVYKNRALSNGYYNFGGQTTVEAGAGSGIVMTEDGYIITNWHVVTDEDTDKPFDRVDITTYDGTVYENAKIIGADKATDLAVLKIDAEKLSPAQFGDSSKLVIGDRVVALGNATGLHWSASQGIVSGLARDVYEDTGYSIKCLQTDAAINPGNSGGPLLNNQGQVIGVNSAKIAATGYEGLGFSIPINEAKTVIDDLLKHGYVTGRVQLGITGYSVNSNGYKGFVIQEIAKDSMLSKTQARAGDLITAVNGTKIDGYGALRAELAKHKPGETVTLSLLRLDRAGNESTFTVSCTLQESKG